jgi:hypothetical protein
MIRLFAELLVHYQGRGMGWEHHWVCPALKRRPDRDSFRTCSVRLARRNPKAAPAFSFAVRPRDTRLRWWRVGGTHYPDPRLASLTRVAVPEAAFVRQDLGGDPKPKWWSTICSSTNEGVPNLSGLRVLSTHL